METRAGHRASPRLAAFSTRVSAPTQANVQAGADCKVQELLTLNFVILREQGKQLKIK